jgi:hypothetical protein
MGVVGVIVSGKGQVNRHWGHQTACRRPAPANSSDMGDLSCKGAGAGHAGAWLWLWQGRFTPRPQWVPGTLGRPGAGALGANDAVSESENFLPGKCEAGQIRVLSERYRLK